MANNFHGLGRKHEFLVPVRLSSLPSYAFPPSSPPGYATFVWLTVRIMLYLSSFPYRLIYITKIPRSGHGTSPKFTVSVNIYILNSQFRPCSIPLVPRPVSATLHSPDFLWAMRHSPTHPTHAPNKLLSLSLQVASMGLPFHWAKRRLHASETIYQVGNFTPCLSVPGSIEKLSRVMTKYIIVDDS